MDDYIKLIPEVRASMTVSHNYFAKLFGVTAVTVSRCENE